MEGTLIEWCPRNKKNSITSIKRSDRKWRDEIAEFTVKA